jgi:quercetin dioxygenase-like cupin family protein
VKCLPAAEAEAQPADPNKFSGTVVHEELLSAQTDGGMRVHRFSYEPEARSRWHVHDGEQAVYVLSGAGAMVNADGQCQRVAPGDLIYVAPGERHWHGAAPNQFFVHLAFTARGGTTWAEEVSAAEYRQGFEGG